MKGYPYFVSLCVLFIVSCSTENNTSSNTSKTISQPNEIAGDSTVCIFGTSIHLDEDIAIRELSAAGILKCDSTNYKDDQFEGAIIEFAGVKFGFNKGFVFITSKQDKKTIDSLVSKISSYYGKPDIDDNGDQEHSYYHWNLYNASFDEPYIRIRPLHSDEGGFTMTWNWI